MLGRMFVAFLAVVAALGVVGLLMNKRAPQKETRDDTENVVDLRDGFNRARNMKQDGN